MIYFYVCSIFLFVSFLVHSPQSLVYFILAHFTLDAICARLYIMATISISHSLTLFLAMIFVSFFLITRDKQKKISDFLIFLLDKCKIKSYVSSIF